MDRLSPDCMSYILSLTSPADICRAASVSTIFFSASISDLVWQRFIPANLLISSSSTSTLSNRDLFLRLCDKPILIDNGNMSFGLEKMSGLKCFMLGARALKIVWGENPNYWRWYSEPDSRFSEVAELLAVCWLEIHGEIESRLLSQKTIYMVYLVFKLRDGGALGLYHPPQKTCVKLGDQVVQLKIRLKPSHTPMLHFRGGIHIRRCFTDYFTDRNQEEKKCESSPTLPQERNDGWMEVELGEFYNDEGEDGEVKISLTEVEGAFWKNGLIIQGIEIRPKR